MNNSHVYKPPLPPPIFHLPPASRKEKQAEIRVDTSTRGRHLRLLNDVLHLSIQRRQWDRAARAWSILARCPEVDWMGMCRIGLLILSQNEKSGGSIDPTEDTSETSRKRIDFVRAVIMKDRFRQEAVLQELIIELIAAGNYEVALEELKLYLPSMPFNQNPILNTYAGLLHLYLAQPKPINGESGGPSQMSGISAALNDPMAAGAQQDIDFSTFSRSHLLSAFNQFNKALELDPGNSCATAFSSLVETALQSGPGRGRRRNESQTIIDSKEEDEIDSSFISPISIMDDATDVSTYDEDIEEELMSRKAKRAKR